MAKYLDVPVGAARQDGVPLAFLGSDGVRATAAGDHAALRLPARLTSYRSLPLSCIRDIRVAIDGAAVSRDQITFVLDGHTYLLDDLVDRTDIWWYILDYAELVVVLDKPLPPGSHTVEGSLTTLVPFATGGRTTTRSNSVVNIQIGEE